jgi:hypothetical protein
MFQTESILFAWFNLIQDPERKAASKLGEGTSTSLFATKQRSDAGAPVFPAGQRSAEIHSDVSPS